MTDKEPCTGKSNLEILTDLTNALNEKDEQIRRSEKILRAILEASPVGICLVENRTIQWSNPAFTTITGYTVEEVIGMPVSSIYGDEHEYARAGNYIYRDHLGGNKTGTMRVKITRKDGIVSDCILRISYLNGEATKSVVAVLTNVNELAQLCNEI